MQAACEALSRLMSYDACSAKLKVCICFCTQVQRSCGRGFLQKKQRSEEKLTLVSQENDIRDLVRIAAGMTTKDENPLTLEPLLAALLHAIFPGNNANFFQLTEARAEFERGLNRLGRDLLRMFLDVTIE